jgi:hypothetical protein
MMLQIMWRHGAANWQFGFLSRNGTTIHAKETADANGRKLSSWTLLAVTSPAAWLLSQDGQ